MGILYQKKYERGGDVSRTPLSPLPDILGAEFSELLVPLTGDTTTLPHLARRPDSREKADDNNSRQQN